MSRITGPYRAKRASQAAKLLSSLDRGDGKNIMPHAKPVRPPSAHLGKLTAPPTSIFLNSRIILPQPSSILPQDSVPPCPGLSTASIPFHAFPTLQLICVASPLLHRPHNGLRAQQRGPPWPTMPTTTNMPRSSMPDIRGRIILYIRG